MWWLSITRWFLFFHLLIFQISSQEQLRLEPLPVVAPSGEEGGQDIDLELFQHHDDEDPGLLHVIQRYLMGSNCVMIEKGTAPPYEKCYGCEIQRAMNCLSDLRTNVTGNVPSGCKLNSLNSNYDTTCCPVYVQKKRKIFLRFETSGYPSALSCLRKVGCQATQVIFFLSFLLLISSCCSLPLSILSGVLRSTMTCMQSVQRFAKTISKKTSSSLAPPLVVRPLSSNSTLCSSPSLFASWQPSWGATTSCK
jgi:hypothetical protein